MDSNNPASEPDRSSTPTPDPKTPATGISEADRLLLIRTARAAKARLPAEERLPSPVRASEALANVKIPPADPEAQERRRERERQAKAEREQARREANWVHVAIAIGPRYAECSVENFELSTDDAIAKAQSAALRKIAAYERSLMLHAAQGHGLMFLGPPGTGKDHLLAHMMRVACVSGLSVEWVNGMDLFGDMRDSMDKDETERDLLKRFISPSILAISDPVPPWGPLTQFQAAFLFRLIDRRYRDRKPIWVTANIASKDEGTDRLGSQVYERLKDGSLVVHCDWSSHRKVMNF